MPPIPPDIPSNGVPDPRVPSDPRPSVTPPRNVAWARRFPPTGLGVRGARTFAAGSVASALRGAPAGSPEAVEALAQDVALVASELASNAARHAATPFEVLLDFGGGHVRVEVRDGSEALPRTAVPGAGATGRGLVVVDRLASAWGAEPTGRGKVVWAELPTGVLARDVPG